ncbi:MAG: fatty acid desaturase [Rhizobiales bacterium]|nr:fatty acid desaturase [Hyphomicrobiales bacterium]
MTATTNITDTGGGAARKRSTEWPTIGLIVLVYAALAILVWFHASLPWWIILPIGAYFTALQSSLQHEVLHGHPTGNRLLNEALVFPSPHLWLPFRRYRDTHLTHHNDDNLTDPRFDPESYYLLPEDWAAITGPKKILFELNHTLAGRMILGPAISMARFWRGEFAEIARGDRHVLQGWLLFIPSAAITILYVVGIAGMPFWKYYFLIAYPGISLALVRSYCEHRAAPGVPERTVAVEASPFWSLLYLNNNLHVAHHTWPNLAWYKLPAYYRAEKARLLEANHGYAMNGYGEVFRRYFFSAKEPISYPDVTWLKREPSTKN